MKEQHLNYLQEYYNKKIQKYKQSISSFKDDIEVISRYDIQDKIGIKELKNKIKISKELIKKYENCLGFVKIMGRIH